MYRGLPDFTIIVGAYATVNWLSGSLRPASAGSARPGTRAGRDTITPCVRGRLSNLPCASLVSPLTFVLMMALLCTSACTFYGDHPAKAFTEATGGEGLERVFWKNVQAANWVELERVLASNYAGVTPGGTLDRSATTGSVPELAAERLLTRRFENRDERIDDRCHLHDHFEWNCWLASHCPAGRST